MHRIALADSFHLHARNFPSLFKCMEKVDVTPTVFLNKGDEGYGLITCLGDYSDLTTRVSPFIRRYIQNQAEVYAAQEADQLYAATVVHLRIWPLCRSEMLAYLLTRDNWQQEVMPKNDRAIFDKAHAENRDVLALNMAAATFWLNHWYDLRKEVFKNHYCCIFSGSMTYARTLMELLRRSPTRAMVMESTFTGNDYVFEEMYHPVANNLGVQFSTVRAGRRQPEVEAPNQYDREVIKARNKVLSARNKNVVQPPPQALPRFPEDRPQLLIAGQVTNDFSLIEQGFPYVGSIPVYIELIRRLLAETDCNIVFKAHPWENRKAHLRAPMTFNALADFVAGLPDDTRARVLLVEDVNLHALIEDSDHFVTLCSQAGIEAALLGLRPFVLGRAFYSGAGFTTDCPDIETLVAAIGQSPDMLDLEGYAAFDRFLVDLFQYGTVSVFESGEKTIARHLVRSTSLDQKTPLRSELELGSTDLRARSTPARWNGILRKKLSLPDDADSIRSLKPEIAVDLVDLPKTVSRDDGFVHPRVTVANNSGYVLPARLAGKPFRLSYHILTDAGERYVWNGETVDLPGDIHTAARLRLSFKIPSDPGHYKVIPGLFYPGVCWYDSDRSWEITVE